MAIDAIWIMLAVWAIGWVIPVILYHIERPIEPFWISIWECSNCGRGHISIRRFEPNRCRDCGEVNWHKANQRGRIPTDPGDTGTRYEQ